STTRRALALSRRSRVRTCSSTSRRSRPRASGVWPRVTTWNSTSPRVQRGCKRRTFAKSERAATAVVTGPDHTGPVCFSYILAHDLRIAARRSVSGSSGQAAGVQAAGVSGLLARHELPGVLDQGAGDRAEQGRHPRVPDDASHGAG